MEPPAVWVPPDKCSHYKKRYPKLLPLFSREGARRAEGFSFFQVEHPDSSVGKEPVGWRGPPLLGRKYAQCKWPLLQKFTFCDTFQTVNQMTNCYMCTVAIDDNNRSSEHIILNSMGGRLKSTNLLCEGCNSTLGDGIDAELSRQFEFLSGYLQIKRDRGTIPIIKGGKTKGGTEIHLVDGSTPRLADPIFETSIGVNGDLEYHIVARDEKEMRRILKGLKRKHPAFDVDEAMTSARKKVERLKEAVHYQQTFGGDVAFRSIAKSAISFFLLKKGERKHIEHLISYVLGKVPLDIVKYYHSPTRLYMKEAGEVIHLLHLVGDKYKKVLYCYIEFFSTHSFVVLLSDNYKGRNLRHSYSYDVIKGCEVKKEVHMSLTTEEISKLPSHFTYVDTIKSKTDRLMKIASKIHTDKEIGNITRRAVEDILQNKYGHEPIINEVMMNELVHRVTTDYVELIYGRHQVSLD